MNSEREIYVVGIYTEAESVSASNAHMRTWTRKCSRLPYHFVFGVHDCGFQERRKRIAYIRKTLEPHQAIVYNIFALQQLRKPQSSDDFYAGSRRCCDQVASSATKRIAMALTRGVLLALVLQLLFLQSTVISANVDCLPSDNNFCRCSTSNITLDIAEMGLSFPWVLIYYMSIAAKETCSHVEQQSKPLPVVVSQLQEGLT